MTLAFVNHQRASEVSVIDVRRRRVVRRIRGGGAGSSDEAISPDGRELWLGHPADAKTTVIDARRFRVLTILETGPRTNHPTFVSKRDGEYAYVTVGGVNQTLVYRRGGAAPKLVKRIANSGEAPHGLWPSPDNSRVYVALQKSDAVDVIDTATDEVVSTLKVGQDPQALVYVAGAVPRGTGTARLTRQGLGRRVQTLAAEVRGGGAGGKAKVTVREVDALDELDFTASGLPPKATFTAFGVRGDRSAPLRDVTTDAEGGIDEALAFADFFDAYDRVVLVPKGQRP